MSKKHKQNQYGTFTAGLNGRLRNKKKLIAVCLSALVLVFVIIFGLQRQSRDQTSLATEIPQIVDSALPGWWYAEYFGASVCEKDICRSDADPDNDKLTNAQEFYYHSNPLNRDTNNNGLTDGEDVASNFDPSKPGKVTFEEAASDDVFVGEGLVFAEDIKKELSKSQDINAVKLPEVNELELNIIDDNSEEALTQYSESSSALIEEYFPGNQIGLINQTLLTYNLQKKQDITLRSLQVYSGLKKLSVPSDLLTFHKYNILLFQLIPEVLSTPDDALLGDEFSSETNYWIDSTKQLLVVMQKLDLEAQVLGKKYQ
ncbi:MAG: hypothetical protein HYW51_01285 [Candidatus Doudnabacteria bacterium]|nr:hypothetical protein [Candidatus Doudnabacteria bacterium]